ncbi:MGDG synthase family glycosyltransferase [Mesobacillus zeae]|uniref:UDP-glucuronosyltransferase n=1 Tax=Mesobacillus zeae TaxID=1917180 RepID=A0A398B6M8_9BACI|nr:glycosyltransferase [Mesobacillus zeae]RID85759.1 UDP-glucuronosyltransferase [Mesobacillus zeae]
MERPTVKKKILFLPFLQIPSGHHQVAKALLEGIQLKQPDIKCEVVDILSYSLGKMEGLVSNIYLGWIKILPQTYNIVYRWNAYTNLARDKRFRLYELLFIKYMRRLLEEKQPDLIVCTHGLPSYLLNYLKEIGEVSTPVINVYTDFFINKVWGIQHIDFHFVPTYEMKKFLNQRGIKESQLFLTGIPIHHKIRKEILIKTPNPSFPLSVLVTGGNLGVGAMEKLVSKIGNDKNVHFSILCGTNRNLFRKIKSFQKSNITPIEYIESRQEMNDLYDKTDAILTKPGGVTLSECLFKGKPIFIYHCLPGQEEINLQTLERLGIIMRLKLEEENSQSVGKQLASFFQDKFQLDNYHSKVSRYLQQIIDKEPSEIIEELLGLRV